MKRLFLSDIHLNSGVNEAEKQKRLLALLDSIDPAEWSDIYLLGDIFDFWFEYKTVIVSAYYPFLHALTTLRKQGIRLHMLAGNHDFWIGSFLRDEMAMAIHDGDGTDVDVDGVPGYFFHGDGLNPTDKGYLFLKWAIRKPLLQWMLRQVHPDWAFAFGKWFSAWSRKKGSPQLAMGNPHERQWMHLHALQQFNRGRRFAVCGHCHVPEIIHIQEGETSHTYVNCGDWNTNFTYAVWESGAFSLHRSGAPEDVFPPGDALELPPGAPRIFHRPGTGR